VRILITVERLTPTGGREISVLELSRELARRGHEIDLFYDIGGELETEYRSFCRSITHAQMAIRPPRLLLSVGRTVPSAWAAKRHRPQVVFVQRFAEIPFGVIVGRLAQAPVVCCFHGYMYRRRTALLARYVSRFIAVSDDARHRWVRAGVNPARIDVVHNGINPQDYPFGGWAERATARRTLGLSPAALIVLYYGRLDAEKGVEVLLEAWRLADISPDDARLLLIGQPVIDPDPAGYARRLRDLAPPGCQWLAMRRDVVTPLHAADLVVLPSFSEGLPRTVIEAMATGRPVVASRVGGIPEVLSGPYDENMFEAGDAEGLAQLLRNRMDWRSRDPGLGARCRAHVIERFTVERMTDGVEQVLLEAARL